MNDTTRKILPISRKVFKIFKMAKPYVENGKSEEAVDFDAASLVTLHWLVTVTC